MRLIDADELHDALRAKQKWVVRCGDKHNEGYTYDQVHFAIDDAPTVDRPQGEWIAKTENYHSHWVCSECGAWALLDWNEQMCLSNFCPNCGCQMKGADDDI